MKLCVQKFPDLKKVTVEGAEAKAVLREVLGDISKDILFPTMPYTGKIRCRCKDRLREGGNIWSKSDQHGNPHKDAIILSMPLKIVGIIKEDGTYEEVGKKDQPAYDPDTAGTKDAANVPAR